MTLIEALTLLKTPLKDMTEEQKKKIKEAIKIASGSWAKAGN